MLYKISYYVISDDMASETGAVAAKCGCKGIRTCLVCEHKNAIVPQVDKPQMALYQCHKCGRIMEARAPCGRLDPDAPPLYSCQSICSNVRVLLASHRQEWQFEGVTVVKDFISAEEEDLIVGEINSRVWAESQSGRRKQVCALYKLCKLLAHVATHLRN